jgi:hypothetical protein
MKVALKLMGIMVEEIVTMAMTEQQLVESKILKPPPLASNRMTWKINQSTNNNGSPSHIKEHTSTRTRTWRMKATL